MKIRSVGVDLFHADRQTDRQTHVRTDGWTETDTTQLTVASRSFSNAPKT